MTLDLAALKRMHPPCTGGHGSPSACPTCQLRRVIAELEASRAELADIKRGIESVHAFSKANLERAQRAETAVDALTQICDSAMRFGGLEQDQWISLPVIRAALALAKKQ